MKGSGARVYGPIISVMPKPTSKPITPEQAIENLRRELNSDAPTIRREDILALVVGFAAQQARLQKWEERATDLDDAEVDRLCYLAAGALAADREVTGDAAAGRALDALAAIRKQIRFR